MRHVINFSCLTNTVLCGMVIAQYSVWMGIALIVTFLLAIGGSSSQ